METKKYFFSITNAALHPNVMSGKRGANIFN